MFLARFGQIHDFWMLFRRSGEKKIDVTKKIKTFQKVKHISDTLPKAQRNAPSERGAIQNLAKTLFYIQKKCFP